MVVVLKEVRVAAVRRALEALFRRPSRFILLLVLLPILGAAVGFMLPRSYQAQASLWANQRYAVIGATGSESDLLATEAGTQVTALNELLQTRVFALQVANQTQLINTLSPAVKADPNARDDALVQDISGRVLVATQGTYVYTISYTDKSPEIAQQVVAAVIKSFGEQSQGLSVIEGQNLLQAYQAQLPAAEKAADAAAQAEAQYINQHPTETAAQLTNDPQYSLLHAKTQQAQATLQNLRTQIATLQQEIGLLSGGPSTLFTVLDQPTAPVRPVSRTKTLIMAGGGGVALALLACALYLALLVRRDRALYTPAEVQRATELRVLLQLPALPTSTVSASRRALAVADARTSPHKRIRAPRT